jgi:N-acetylglucosamine kinase-like BadF-type ATPase
MSRLFLGVDGGQSSTTAMIGDETGSVVGFGRGGECNHVKGPEGRSKFINAIDGCIGLAGFQGAQFEAACLGFSGGPVDKEELLREMLRVTRTMTVTHDGLIALTGATAGVPGSIMIAGTGSFAFGRNAEGRSARVGGWGYIFGDEGGGYDITRQALRAALRYEEGWGPPTVLHSMLLDATGEKTANDLVHRFYTVDYPRPKIASYSKLVDQASVNGDALARGILLAAAQQLAGFTSAIRGQLFKKGEPAFVAYIGGVYHSNLLLERFRMLVELEDGNTVGPPKLGPAAGALIEAYRSAGLNPTLSNLPESEK